MDHFWAIASALFAVSIVVAVSAYSHCAATAAIYTSTQQAHSDGSQVTAGVGSDWTTDAKANSNFLLCLAREGARWSRRAQTEARIWCVTLLILLFFVVGYAARMRV